MAEFQKNWNWFQKWFVKIGTKLGLNPPTIQGTLVQRVCYDVHLLEQYSSEQISRLLTVLAAYKKAKKNPDLFVEQFFSAKILPGSSLGECKWTDGLRVEGVGACLAYSWDGENQ